MVARWHLVGLGIARRETSSLLHRVAEQCVTRYLIERHVTDGRRAHRLLDGAVMLDPEAKHPTIGNGKVSGHPNLAIHRAGPPNAIGHDVDA